MQTEANKKMTKLTYYELSISQAKECVSLIRYYKQLSNE